MKDIVICISVETKKFFNSKIPLLTMLALLLIPFMGGFFMFVLKDSDLAQGLGFISTKASIIGTADWPSYLGLLSQAISIGGLMVFGFIMSWIFGREYSDRTIKDLLALPISRHIIVLSKFIVAVIWCLFLTIFILILGFIVGKGIGISGWEPEIIANGILTFIICSFLTTLLSTPIAFFASMGRGYLSPLGFMIFTLVLAQLIAAAGYGQFFPWSIPAIISGITDNIKIENISIIIVLLTSLFGIVSTMLWWRYADQH